MSKFPPGTTFTANNETEGFMCIEMKTQRPWTYQTDLFGVLGTVYTLLFQNYMLVTYNGQLWQPAKFNLHRIYKSRLWAEMFTELLNIESCDRIPSVCDWREKFEAEFSVKEYSKEYKRINNMMK
ncbi:hypothetical protein EB796_014938 [Bugula neritina]|uniref:Uncharacterized protein n=1 Tax=Bugula neritina TaxID=10212 RepID=A0A7J7JKU1_BUGNE|nr:hypothetical protein EB796_014938 [Bugula neritina]